MGLRDPPSPPWEEDRDQRRSDLGRVALDHSPASSLLHPIILPPLYLPFCDGAARSPVAVDVLSTAGLGSLSIPSFSHLPRFGDRFGKALFEEPLYPNRMASNAMDHSI
uniref:Uncharacterized protein n=1 Tax=Fagus sylvatica TaxID=28930 RepID=A0A2N9E8X3_FAGSY